MSKSDSAFQKMVKGVRKEAGGAAKGSHLEHGRMDEVGTTVNENKGNHNTM